ncbi:unnamed protein product, partial [Ectocarpus sp. 12 AP-2014]
LSPHVAELVHSNMRLQLLWQRAESAERRQGGYSHLFSPQKRCIAIIRSVAGVGPLHTNTAVVSNKHLVFLCYQQFVPAPSVIVSTPAAVEDASAISKCVKTV